MNNITYGISKEIYSLGGNIRESYGIVAYANTELDGTATIIASVKDITSDKKRLQNLVDKCNELNLSLAHFNDIVEDFLAK